MTRALRNIPHGWWFRLRDYEGWYQRRDHTVRDTHGGETACNAQAASGAWCKFDEDAVVLEALSDRLVTGALRRYKQQP